MLRECCFLTQIGLAKNIIGIMLREGYGRDTSHVGSEGTGLNLVNST